MASILISETKGEHVGVHKSTVVTNNDSQS